MKKVLALLLALTMVLSLAACGDKNTGNEIQQSTSTETNSSAPEQQTSVEVAISEPTAEVEYAKEITVATDAIALDPGDVWSTSREFWQILVFDGLVKRDFKTGEFSPLLAKTIEWEGEGSKRLHVVLRDDIFFSNGDPVTTADVEFSFGRSQYSGITNYYESSEIVSDTEMYINLSAGNSLFFDTLAKSCGGIVSKAETEKNPDNLGLIGSGAWTYDLDSYIVDASVSLVRNENYWGEYDNPTEKINVVYIKDPSARAIALQSGEINFAFGLSATEIPSLTKDESLDVHLIESSSFEYVGFNDRKKTDELTEEEINLRRAVACAFPKEDLLIATGNEGGKVMVGFGLLSSENYIDNEAGFDDGIDLSYNPERAKEYLAKAGGKTELNCLILSGNAASQTCGQMIQEYCHQVGITLNFIEMDSAAFTAEVKGGDPSYDMFVWNNSMSLPISSSYFSQTGTVNRALINNAAILASIDQALSSQDSEVLAHAEKTIQNETHKTVSYLPLFWCVKNLAYTKGVEGIVVNSIPNYDIHNIRLRID